MRELVLTFCPEDFGDRAAQLAADPEDAAHAAVNPLFELRPATGARLLDIALAGRPVTRAWAHAPRLFDDALDRVELDELGFLVAYQEADGRRHHAPIGAGRDWLRELLAGGAGGLLDVRVSSSTPFGAVWETCLEARYALRGGVRLSIPVPGMYSRAIHFPRSSSEAPITLGGVVRRGLGAVCAPLFVFFLLLVVGPLFLLVHLVALVAAPIRSALRTRVRRRARSELEHRLFTSLGRCPACGEFGLAFDAEACGACEAVILVEEPEPAGPGLARIDPSAAPSELIDLWGWIELAEARREDAGLRAQWEVVQCLQEALKFHTPDGEPVDGAFFTPTTRALAEADPARCSRERIVSWLFELPTQAEVLAAYGAGARVDPRGQSLRSPRTPT